MILGRYSSIYKYIYFKHLLNSQIRTVVIEFIEGSSPNHTKDTVIIIKQYHNDYAGFKIYLKNWELLRKYMHSYFPLSVIYLFIIYYKCNIVLSSSQKGGRESKIALSSGNIGSLSSFQNSDCVCMLLSSGDQ